MTSDDLSARGITRGRTQEPQLPVQWARTTQFTVPMPPDEKDRLADLRSFKVLDTPPEEELDNLTQLAAHICGTPMALISLVDASRQWFKSRLGVEFTGTPREYAFCAYAILQPDLFIVPDALKDPRFRSSPLATSGPAIRFYAGAPLVSPDGHVLGTLCVMDRVPRHLTRTQAEVLRALSRQVMNHLVMRRQLHQLRDELLELHRTEKRLQNGKQTVEASGRIKYELLQNLGLHARESLTDIGKLTEQVLAGELTSKQRGFLSTVKTRANELLALTNQILDSARVEVTRR